MNAKIYISCMRCSSRLHYMMATSEDGEYIDHHVSSDHDFGKLDMGIGSDRKHKQYKEKFPDGYELIWKEKTEEQTT